MNRMSRSATSMKKPEHGTLQTFASLRFSGDALEPQRLTAILNARPEMAYRKADVFKVSRGHEVRGRTGVWVISRKGDISSLDLNEHLDYLLGLLFPAGSEAKLNRLHELMRESSTERDAACL